MGRKRARRNCARRTLCPARTTSRLPWTTMFASFYIAPGAIYYFVTMMQVMFDIDANLRRIAPVSYFKYAPLRAHFEQLERLLSDGDYKLMVENRHYEWFNADEYRRKATYWPCRVAFVIGERLSCISARIERNFCCSCLQAIKHC